MLSFTLLEIGALNEPGPRIAVESGPHTLLGGDLNAVPGKVISLAVQIIDEDAPHAGVTDFAVLEEEKELEEEPEAEAEETPQEPVAKSEGAAETEEPPTDEPPADEEAET